MKGISYHAWFSPKPHTHRSITVWEAIGAIPFEAALVNELSSQKSIGEMDCNLNVVRWPMWRKMVIGTRVIPLRKSVLRVGECMIFEIASFSSPLKLSQLQWCERRCSVIEKDSRWQNVSWRMASSDVPFIHSVNLGLHLSLFSVRVMDLTEDWMTGFWTKNWWIPWQDWSLPRVILEKRCLRLGRRNEDETRAHCLSTRVSLPAAAITLSMMSWGRSIKLYVRPHRLLGSHSRIHVWFDVIIIKILGPE